MGTGGNAGGQSSATIIRGIALNEISIRDYFKVVWKEIRVAVLLGLSLAIACFLKLLYIDGLFQIDNGYLVSAVVCLAMFITVLVAKIVGCTLPLIAKQCKLDPAVMASPFITTILDTLSLLILCGLTTAILPI
jgi:magnesium transporter